MTSGGESSSKKLRCLLCEGQMRKSNHCSLRHIEGHLKYKKYRCEECAYRCCSEDSCMMHKWKSGHRIVSRANEYLEKLASKIYIDCLYAADFGIKPLLSAMQAECLSRSRTAGFKKTGKGEPKEGSGDVLKVNAAERNINDRSRASQRREDEITENEGDIPDKPHEEHTQDDTQKMLNTAEEPPVLETLHRAKRSSGFARSEAVAELADPIRSEKGTGPPLRIIKKKMRVSNSPPGKTVKLRRVGKEVMKKGQSVESEVSREQSSELRVADAMQRNVNTTGDTENGADLKTDTARKVACRKCAKKVKNEYVKRRQHVLKYHHKGVTDKDMDEVLPDQIRACFPQCLIYSDTQCTECGKEYKSESGRRYHAMRHHLQYMLKCVVHGCTVQEHSPADLKIHIQNDHEVMISNEVNADLFRVFLCEKKKFDAALATEIIRCFPINLRANPPVPATVTDDVGSPALSNIVNAMKSIIMDSMRGEPVEAPLKSRKRQESTSSSSSDGDSRLQRYKGEGNKGGSNSTGPSPTTAGDESARLQHADSQPEKAVPSGDQSPSQTQSPRIAPSQSQMLQTLTVLESESPSSDDDSDYQRYMEAMRNKGRSDVASPSQTSSDNESPCCTAFHSEKAVPPRRTVTITTQSQVLPSTAASSHLQFSSSTTTQPQLRGHLYPTKASTVGGPSPIEPQLYHKRKTLLPLNAVPQQMFMQQSCHAVVGLNCASSSQRSSSTLGFINGPAAFPNSVQLPPMLRGTADRNISIHAGNERNSDERSSRIFHDSSVYGRRGREGWQDGFKPEASGYDQEEKASQPFHFLSEKQQSSRNGRVAAANGRRVLARRSGGSKRGRSARLSKCAKMASGERKRKKTFGGSVYGQQPNRTPIKAPPSGRWRSPKKKGKSTCKKRSSSMNFASNTSDGDMVKSEAGSSASASCRAPKTRCAGKWKRIHISNRSKTR